MATKCVAAALLFLAVWLVVYAGCVIRPKPPAPPKPTSGYLVVTPGDSIEWRMTEGDVTTSR